MKGVTFGGFHSFAEWGLILSEKAERYANKWKQF